MSSPVTMQLKAWHHDVQNGDVIVDTCWEGVYSASLRNDDRGFKAESD